MEGKYVLYCLVI